VLARALKGSVQSVHLSSVRPGFTVVPWYYDSAVMVARGAASTGYHNALREIQGGDLAHIAVYHSDQPINIADSPYWNAVGIGVTPAYPLHVQKSAIGDDRVLGFFKNTSPADTNYAAVVVENEIAGHAAVLAQFGAAYAGVPAFANKSALYSAYDPNTGIGSDGLMLLAINGMVEFWLYKQGSPSSGGSTYHNVANVRCTDTDVGFMPGLDSTFDLGADALRWKAGYFDDLLASNLGLGGAVDALARMAADGQYYSALVDHGSPGASHSISLAEGNVHLLTLTEACALTITDGRPGGRYACSFLQSGGSWAVTFPGITVYWVGSVAPTWSGTGKRDTIALFCIGTDTYIGGQAMNAATV
jgi:hypothetical protein